MFQGAQNCCHNFKLSLRPETSRFVNTERRHTALFRNVVFSTLSIFFTLTFQLCITFQTRNGSHVFRISTHIVDGLQLIQFCDGLYTLGGGGRESGRSVKGRFKGRTGGEGGTRSKKREREEGRKRD